MKAGLGKSFPDLKNLDFLNAISNPGFWIIGR
jgi:hypothetical protein